MHPMQRRHRQWPAMALLALGATSSKRRQHPFKVGVPRSLIPFAHLRRDVLDVGALAQKLLEEGVQ